MRSVQEETLIDFYQKLRKGSIYNRKWWNPLEFSIYVHDLIRYEEITDVIEGGTGNGVTCTWAALAGASVTTTDTAIRPKVWDDPNFPLPHLALRIFPCTQLADDLFRSVASLRKPTDGVHLWILDAATSEKAFRRDWSALSPMPGDIIVSPIGHPEIYQSWMKIAKAGFKVTFNSLHEAYTTRWPSDGANRDW